MEDLIEADQQSSGPPNNIMAVRARARNSVELEAMEASLLAYSATLDGRLPLPFYADGEIEPLGEIAVKQLAELGISADEYVALMMGE